MAVMHKEDMEQQNGDTPKIHEDLAKRQEDWPEWYSESRDGEKGYIECGSYGAVVVDCTGIGHRFTEIAFDVMAEENMAEARNLTNEMFIYMLVNGVVQWGEKFGPLFRNLPDDQRLDKLKEIPSKYVERIRKGVEILTKN